MTKLTNTELFDLATAETYAPDTAPLEVVAVHSRLAVEAGMKSDSNISADFTRMISEARKGTVSAHIKAQIALSYKEMTASNKTIKEANKVLKAKIKIELATNNPKWSKKQLEAEAIKAKDLHSDFQKTTQGVYAAYCVAARRGYEKVGYTFTADKHTYKVEKLVAATKAKAKTKPKAKADTSNTDDGGMLDNDNAVVTMSTIRAFIIDTATTSQQSELAELLSDLAKGVVITA